MTTKNILEKAASLLELTVNFTTVNATSARFLSCGELILNELTSQYTDLKKTETVFQEGEVLYSSLSKGPVLRILSVKQNGRKVKFREGTTSFEVSCKGQAEVTYSYCIKDVTLTTNIELPPRFTDDLLALGVAAEYCYRTGFNDGAQKYGERYTTALQNVVGCKKTVVLSARRYL